MVDKSTKNEPFVSVLTPVYNGADYIEECIQSVLKQTYTNWEYVIINNQSTDNSLEIIEKYAAQDDRIRIHNNEKFLSVVDNHNHAFSQMSPESKYCKVVHTDDWLFPECIAQMVELNEQYPSVGIVSSYRLDGIKDRTYVELDGLPYPSNFNSGKEIARKYLLHGTSYFGSPSSILMRSDLIRNREKVYEDSHMASDTGACLDLLQDSDFGFVHQVLTFQRVHENSVTNTKVIEDHSFIHAVLFSQLKHGPIFLSEEEHRQRLDFKLNLFYILLARNLITTRSIVEFKKQKRILDKLGFEFNAGCFAKNFVREILLQTVRGLRLEPKK